MKEKEEHSMPVDGLSAEAVRQLMEKVAQMEKRDVEQQRRIAELEGEVACLKERQEVGRTFKFDDMVTFAKNFLTLEMSMPVQNMLYHLLAKDGTPKERETVASIATHIINRGIIRLNNPTFQKGLYEITGNQNVNLGGISNG